MAELFDKAETTGNRFLSPTSRTARLVEEARRYIPGGTSRIHYYFAPYPIYAQSGSGCRLTDVDGVERLDFLNNMTSLVHGHANPTINEAIVAQLAHGTAFSEPSEPEVRLAKLIVERVPSVQQIRFANSGTEAVMMAIKLARAFTGRHRIAKFEGFYHGYYDYVQVSFNSTPETWGSIDQPAAIASSGGLAELGNHRGGRRPPVQRPGRGRAHPRPARIVARRGHRRPIIQSRGFPSSRRGFLRLPPRDHPLPRHRPDLRRSDQLSDWLSWSAGKVWWGAGPHDIWQDHRRRLTDRRGGRLHRDHGAPGSRRAVLRPSYRAGLLAGIPSRWWRGSPRWNKCRPTNTSA